SCCQDGIAFSSPFLNIQSRYLSSVIILTQVNNEYRLDHASADALKSILFWFADYGFSIHVCRTFIKTPSKTATLQAFSAALSTQLQTFNSKLAELQSTYANLKTQTTSLSPYKIIS